MVSAPFFIMSLAMRLIQNNLTPALNLRWLGETMIRFIIFAPLLLSLAACDNISKQRVYTLDFGRSNLTDSLLYTEAAHLDGYDGMVIALQRLHCGEETPSRGGVSIFTRRVPRHLKVAWYHVLTNTYYQATVSLNPQLDEWLKKSPFGPTVDPKQQDFIVQFRPENKVAVVLVYGNTTSPLRKVDLGEAVGTPYLGEPFELSYKGGGFSGGWYRAGYIVRYDRQLDHLLSPEQRFGCIRDADGRLDKLNYPVEKYPVLMLKGGKFLSCTSYDCREHQALIDQYQDSPNSYYTEKNPQETPVFLIPEQGNARLTDR